MIGRKTLSEIFIIPFSVMSITLSFAADEGAGKTSQPAVADTAAEAGAGSSGKEPMMQDREDLIRAIKNKIISEKEILNYIPELKVEKDESMNDVYTYAIDNRKVRLEDLNDDVLKKVWARVTHQAVVIRAARINAQLQTIARMHSMIASQAAAQAAPKNIPTSQIPKPPQQPPQTPRISQPPQPSQRR